jgi:formate hydrogenlyase subunit 6/NADH:ubiquinone oxidoreductase subunit I
MFLKELENQPTMIVIEHESCIKCVGCSSVCPANAIEYVGERMRTYPEKCIDCGLCVKTCPANAIELFPKVKENALLPIDARKKYGL